MFNKKNKYNEGYLQGRQDALENLIAKMTELSLMNKRFADTLIDAVRGQ